MLTPVTVSCPVRALKSIRTFMYSIQTRGLSSVSERAVQLWCKRINWNLVCSPFIIRERAQLHSKVMNIDSALFVSLKLCFTVDEPSHFCQRWGILCQFTAAMQDTTIKAPHDQYRGMKSTVCCKGRIQMSVKRTQVWLWIVLPILATVNPVSLLSLCHGLHRLLVSVCSMNDKRQCPISVIGIKSFLLSAWQGGPAEMRDVSLSPWRMAAVSCLPQLL